MFSLFVNNPHSLTDFLHSCWTPVRGAPAEADANVTQPSQQEDTEPTGSRFTQPSESHREKQQISHAAELTAAEAVSKPVKAAQQSVR